MTSVRPLFFLLVILFFASTACAAGDGSEAQPSNGSVQNQAVDPALFGQPGQPAAFDLFFLKDKPRLEFAAPAAQPRSAALNNADCYTMRMYKVKRKEHFADGESGSRGYSTCELASKYQVRTAIAHVENAERHDSKITEPQK